MDKKRTKRAREKEQGRIGREEITKINFVCFVIFVFKIHLCVLAFSRLFLCLDMMIGWG